MIVVDQLMAQVTINFHLTTTRGQTKCKLLSFISLWLHSGELNFYASIV